MPRVMIQGENGPILKVDDQGQARVILYGADGQPLFSDTNPAKVQLSGSLVDLRGSAANKPSADAVDPGTTYWSVDTDPGAEAVEVSDGSTWRVMS